MMDHNWEFDCVTLLVFFFIYQGVGVPAVRIVKFPSGKVINLKNQKKISECFKVSRCRVARQVARRAGVAFFTSRAKWSAKRPAPRRRDKPHSRRLLSSSDALRETRQIENQYPALGFSTRRSVCPFRGRRLMLGDVYLLDCYSFAASSESRGAGRWQLAGVGGAKPRGSPSWRSGGGVSCGRAAFRVVCPVPRTPCDRWRVAASVE